MLDGEGKDGEKRKETKMLFLGLSLFGNQTETLATQAGTAAANTATKRIAHEHKI